MESISSIIYFAVLFLGLCLFIVIVIAMYNIVTKSFKPKNSLIVISSLLIFFLLASVLALTNLNDATRYFGESINQSTNGQNLQYQPPNLGGANF